MIVRIESLRWFSEEDQYSKDKSTYTKDIRFVKEEDIRRIIYYGRDDEEKFQSVELTHGKHINNVYNMSYPIHNNKYSEDDY